MNELVEQLKADGWKPFKNGFSKSDASLYKAFPNHEECRCNDGMDKQVEVYLYQWDGKFCSAKVEVCGDIGGDDWIKLKRYGINDPTVAVIESAAESLLDVWDFAVKNHIGSPA